VIGHRNGYTIFTVGNAATAGLEVLAEDGDNSALLTAADADANVVVTGSGTAPIGPAGSETLTITMLESDVATLSISTATMLVNTNDAFSAVSAISVASMVVGDTLEFRAIAYDAGTEADTELAAEIPGPAGGGEGLNTARSDDADRVSMHAGILSQDDGLASSDLTEQHRFDNPVMRVRISRTQ
jgi:energy-converting hydrogenase Eha subunit E